MPVKTSSDERAFLELVHPKDSAAYQHDLANIKTIQAAVSRGRHDTMYYPCSGYDALRCVLAYDVQHLVAVDKDADKLGHVSRTLETMHVDHRTEPNHSVQVTRFKVNGKRRKVTEILKDARKFDIMEFLGKPRVDVLHIYAPADAEDVEPEEEQFKEGILPELNPPNYALVRKGGFLCINENPIGGIAGAREILPQRFFEAAGLKEYPVTGRHANGGSSCMGPDAETHYGSKESYIYQKHKEVDLDAIIELSRVVEAASSANIALLQMRQNGHSPLMRSLAELKTDLHRAEELLTHQATVLHRLGVIDAVEMAQEARQSIHERKSALAS